MKFLLRAFSLLTLAVVCYAGPTLAYTSPGAPSGRVNDFAGVLTSEQRQELESAIQNFEQKTGNQLAVVTVRNLAGDTIENYANELFREWGIGDQTKNNGLLFLIALEDRRMRIEVGYGLEGEVTDIATKHIQDDIVRPAFQAGNYWLGIAGGTNELIKLAGGDAEAIAGVSKRSSLDTKSELGNFLTENYAIFGLFAIYAVLSILMKVKKWGKEKQKPIFGITGTVFSLGLWLLGLIGFGTLFYLAFLTLVFTFGNKRGRGFGGGFGGGGFSSGGGGGGFGGGSSGGGGSSSSW